jgi:hypothetical protein
MRSPMDRQGRSPSPATSLVQPRHLGKGRNRSATSPAGLQCPPPLGRPSNIRPIPFRGWPVDRLWRQIDREPAVGRSPLHYAAQRLAPGFSRGEFLTAVKPLRPLSRRPHPAPHSHARADQQRGQPGAPGRLGASGSAYFAKTTRTGLRSVGRSEGFGLDAVASREYPQ